MQEYQEDNLEEEKSDSEDNNTPRLRSAPASLSHLRQGYGRQARGGFSSLSKGHKFAVAGLAFFSVFIIFMWSVQFKKNINQPFNYSSENQIDTNKTATCSGPDCGDDASLMIKDSDGDGITDYDELNIYDTSPYLEDSDSDGFSDKAEIDSDNDPNCPEGRDCYGSEVPSDFNPSTSPSFSQSINDASNNSDLNIDNTNNDNKDAENVLSGQGDASTIRAMLIQAGMDKNILDQISDDDLMKSYQETLGR